MKNYCLPWMAVVVSFLLTAYSFPNSPLTPVTNQSVVTLVYAEGPQSLRTSYIHITGFTVCHGSGKLCAIQVMDDDGDGEISPSEFSRQFRLLDANSNQSLDDERASLLIQKKD